MDLARHLDLEGDSQEALMQPKTKQSGNKSVVKLSAADSLKLIPVLEQFLKAVMDVADVEIIISIDDPDSIT